MQFHSSQKTEEIIVKSKSRLGCDFVIFHVSVENVENSDRHLEK